MPNKKIYIVAAVTHRPGEFPGIETVFKVTPNIQLARLRMVDVVKDSLGIDEALQLMRDFNNGVISDNVKVRANDEVVYQMVSYDIPEEIMVPK